ncbi:LPS assembly lipoprotein LptE [Marinicella sediminis]|uniref:LPS-assembly lipoprotein LptE n=1 Tax=Marinicella sediminis TaxID=1792834 RepID=A0ABV7JC57_9GAMM|nr:LPS assembly lipoprotein LptE [Marinicella sediminis]
MKPFLIGVCLVLITGCGYQLKTAVALDEEFDRTHIQHAITAPLYRPLSVELSSQGITLVEQASDATAQIVIIKDDLSKQIQSIGTNNRVQEYRLDYELVFLVQYQDRIKVPEQTLRLSRDYAFDIGQISGTQAEEQVLREQMYQDMAQMMIRTIANHK